MSDLGKKISELIEMNIKIWHLATRLKNFDNTRRTDVEISPKERVDHFFKVQKFNAERSAKRWEIDKHFDGANESKVNIGQQEEE